MSFRNPILAGNTLVRAAIQSTNYAAGAAGWMIGRDGTAEFNAATFRGTVVVQSNQAVLFYSGTPAAGNLVLAIAPVAGTDSFGNAYNQGLTIGSAGGFEIVLGLTGGSPLMFFPTGRAAITNSAALQTIVQGTGTGQYEQLQALGPQDSTQKDSVDTAWLSSSPDGTQQPQILDFYHDPSGGYHFYRTLSFAGNASTGPTTAVQPGTGTSRANPAVAETWHAAVLGTGWGPISGLPALEYRVTPDGMIEIFGCVQSTSATPAAVVFTLAAGWAPSVDTRIQICVQRASTGDIAHAGDVGTSGAVTLLNNLTASGLGLYFSCRFPR